MYTDVGADDGFNKWFHFRIVTPSPYTPHELKTMPASSRFVLLVHRTWRVDHGTILHLQAADHGVITLESACIAFGQWQSKVPPRILEMEDGLSFVWSVWCHFGGCQLKFSFRFFSKKRKMFLFAFRSCAAQRRTLLWSYRRGFRELSELFTGMARAQENAETGELWEIRREWFVIMVVIGYSLYIYIYIYIYINLFIYIHFIPCHK